MEGEVVLEEEEGGSARQQSSLGEASLDKGEVHLDQPQKGEAGSTRQQSSPGEASPDEREAHMDQPREGKANIEDEPHVPTSLTRERSTRGREKLAVPASSPAQKRPAQIREEPT